MTFDSRFIDRTIIYAEQNLDDDELDSLIMRLIRLSKQREKTRNEKF